MNYYYTILLVVQYVVQYYCQAFYRVKSAHFSPQNSDFLNNDLDYTYCSQSCHRGVAGNEHHRHNDYYYFGSTHPPRVLNTFTNDVDHKPTSSWYIPLLQSLFIWKEIQRYHDDQTCLNYLSYIRSFLAHYFVHSDTSPCYNVQCRRMLDSC